MKWDLFSDNTIGEFKKKYFFLSNFYESCFVWRDMMFCNSEAAFQSEKTLDPELRSTFTRMTAKEAKAAGRRLALRPDWEEVKDSVMEEIVYEKFSQNDSLTYKLLNTGDATLIEGNTWNDKYWGVDLETGEGENKLGQILMRVRERIREELDASADASAEAAAS